MKTIFILIFFSFLYFLTFSCRNTIQKKEDLFNEVQNVFSKNKIYMQNGDHIAIIVTPIQGCHSCLNVTLKFLEKNIVDSTFVLDNCYILFTNNVSKKYLRNTIGYVLYHSQNVLVDSDNNIRPITNPIVFFIDGEKEYYRELNFENHEEIFNKIGFFLDEPHFNE